MTARYRAGSQPVPHDARLTPPEVAGACIRLLEPLPRGSRILEPSAGTGTWITAIGLNWGSSFEVRANELQPCFRPALERALDPFRAWHEQVGQSPALRIGRFEDYLTRFGGFDLVVGNPPFSLAIPHVRHAMYLLREGGTLAFLLGITFRATQGRRELFRRFPLWRVYVLEERPSFSDDGATDATEYAFFVWKKGYTGDEVWRSFSRSPDSLPSDLAEIRERDWQR